MLLEGETLIHSKHLHYASLPFFNYWSACYDIQWLQGKAILHIKMKLRHQ